MLPAGLAPRRRLAPVRRRARRRDRHHSARGVRERTTRVADPPHRRAAGGSRPAQAGLAAQGARRTGRRSPAESPFSPPPSGGREGSAPAAAMVWMLAVALLGPLLAWPFAWVIGLPLAALSRGPGHARRRERACESPARRLRRDAADAGRRPRLHDLLRQDDPPAADDRADGTSGRRPTTCSAPRMPPGLPPDIAQRPRGACPGSRQASGSFPTSVIVAADGTNLRSFPARAVDASTLAEVVDLGITSGSLEELHGTRARPSAPTARRCSAGTPAIASASARRRDPGHAARGRDLQPAARVRRHRAAARAGRATRHRSFDDTVFVRSAPVRTGEPSPPASSGSRERTLRSRSPPAPQYESQLEDAARRQSLAVYVLLGLIVVFCALALVNAIAMSTAERAREFALLRLIGAGKRAGADDDPRRDADHADLRAHDRHADRVSRAWPSSAVTSRARPSPRCPCGCTAPSWPSTRCSDSPPASSRRGWRCESTPSRRWLPASRPAHRAVPGRRRAKHQKPGPQLTGRPAYDSEPGLRA